MVYFFDNLTMYILSISGVVVVERLELSLQFLFFMVERCSSSCFTCFFVNFAFISQKLAFDLNYYCKLPIVLMSHVYIHDYCNSLYCGLPLKTIKKLQLARQNAAARLIAKISPPESISHILIDLHWLPVTKRCQYKLMVLTYKTLHGTTPVYIINYVTCLIGTTHLGH